MGVQSIFNFLAFLPPVRSDLNFNSAECVSMPIEGRVQKFARTHECRRARAHFYGVTIGTGLKTVLKDKTCVKPSWVFSVYYLFQDFRVWGFED